MYRPRRNKYAPMEGGDYISTSSTPVTISDVTLSTIYFIMSVAQINSIDALTTLTGEQLAAMRGAIDAQIAADQTQIAVNQSKIALLTVDITQPGGLQAQYDAAFSDYNSKLSEYERISSLIIQGRTNLGFNISTLANLYNLSSFYISTLDSYEKSYSTIVSSLSGYQSTVDIYERYYQDNLINISTNTILCDQARDNMSTISSIALNERASMFEPNVNPATASTISTIYSNDMQSFYGISTQAVVYCSSIQYYRAQLLENYMVLSSILSISTFSMIEGNSYRGMIQYYQELEDSNESLIRGYITDISGYINQISDITGQNTALSGRLETEVATVRGSAVTFYSFLKNALEAECDEVAYGVQEYNAQMGFIVASLGIAINANAVSIDNYTLQLLNLTPSSPQWNSVNGLKNTLVVDNNDMSGIMSELNVLDARFNSILNYITNEKALKVSFIQKRNSIFTNYELRALEYTEAEISAIKTAYLAEFSELNQIIIEINAEIRNRRDALIDINEIVDPHKVRINNYFNIYLHVTQDQLPNIMTRVLDDNDNELGMSTMPSEPSEPNSNSIYALIPPIDFN